MMSKLKTNLINRLDNVNPDDLQNEQDSDNDPNEFYEDKLNSI